MRIVYPTRKVTSNPKRVKPLELVVIHYTASPGIGYDKGFGENQARVLNWLDDQKRPSSTHVVILRNGDCIFAAPYSLRTWHAGGSRWNGRADINSISIGIDLENVGRLYLTGGKVKDSYGNDYQGPAPHVAADSSLWEPYTEPQLDALESLYHEIDDKFPRLAWVGHEEIKATKSDPGPAFPWEIIRG